MKDWKPVFLLAKTELIFFAIALVAGLIVIYLANQYANSLRLLVMQEKAALQESQTQLESKKNDLENMESHIQRYQLLKKQGLVGEPERSLWVEELQQSRINLKLPDTLGAQLNESKLLSVNGIEVVDDGTTAQPLMHDLLFELRDVHEQEVLALVEDYRNQVKGRFRINECQLMEPKNTGLTSRCTLRFVTVPAADSNNLSTTGQAQ